MSMCFHFFHVKSPDGAYIRWSVTCKFVKIGKGKVQKSRQIYRSIENGYRYLITFNKSENFYGDIPTKIIMVY